MSELPTSLQVARAGRRVLLFVDLPCEYAAIKLFDELKQQAADGAVLLELNVEALEL